MIDASIALLKCVIDYGLCIWAFSWFAKRKSENRALFLGSIFLSSLFLFGINMLEIPWLNTIVSAFTLLVLFLVVFYTRWQPLFTLRIMDGHRYFRLFQSCLYIILYIWERLLIHRRPQ